MNENLSFVESQQLAIIVEPITLQISSVIYDLYTSIASFLNDEYFPKRTRVKN